MLLDVGAGGTIKSTSYEAAFVEACQLLELAEEASTTPDSVNFTDVSHDNTAKTFNITCALPFTVALTSAGVPTFTPTTYVSPTFANGGGDIDATTLTGAVLQLAQTIQNTERSNASLPNNTNIVYNTDDGIATITASIPCVRSVTAAGAILNTVTTYLP
jgi:hypothetical protein